MTLIGWIPTSIWALVVVDSHLAEVRNKKLIAASLRAPGSDGGVAGGRGGRSASERDPLGKPIRQQPEETRKAMANDLATDLTVKSVSSLLEEIEKSRLLRLPRAHIRVWFRGHADASWELSPGVYRSSFNVRDEKGRLLKERQLTQDFGVMSAGLLSSPRSDVELYFLQQHYRMPTRLLDWTTNPLAALYFATMFHPDKEGSDKEGSLFMMDANQLGPDQCAAWPDDGTEFRGIATSRNGHFERALQPIFRWRKPEGLFPPFIVPVRPNHFDRRIALQRGCFTFHPPGRGTLTKHENGSLKVYTISPDAKKTLRRELPLLGLDDFTVYGDLDRLAEYLKKSYA
jgi:hypothetical protein